MPDRRISALLVLFHVFRKWNIDYGPAMDHGLCCKAMSTESDTIENEPKSPVHIMKARLSRFAFSWSHIVVTCSISVSQLNTALKISIADNGAVSNKPESISSIIKFFISFPILRIGKNDEIVIVLIGTKIADKLLKVWYDIQHIIYCLLYTTRHMRHIICFV